MQVIVKHEIVIAVVFGTLLFVLLTGFIIALILLFQRRRQQHTLEMTDMRSRYTQELLRSQLEIQENTLRAISQEIHDNIGQMLSLAKLQLYTMPENCRAEDLRPTKELIAKSIVDLRDLSKSLHPDRIAEIGLMESIHHELQLLQKTGLMQTFFEVQGEMQKVAAETNVIIFRIFQELMNNAIRHSGASQLHVLMQYMGNKLLIKVADNGRGIGVAASSKGIGLTSMRQRASVIGAVLKIEALPDAGTEATLEIDTAGSGHAQNHG